MPTITFRVTSQEESQIDKAAKKAGVAKSEFIRQSLFNPNTVSKMDFFANVNNSINKFTHQSIFTTQLLCHILVNQTNDPDAVQDLLIEISKKIEMEELDNG